MTKYLVIIAVLSCSFVKPASATDLEKYTWACLELAKCTYSKAVIMHTGNSFVCQLSNSVKTEFFTTTNYFEIERKWCLTKPINQSLVDDQDSDDTDLLEDTASNSLEVNEEE